LSAPDSEFNDPRPEVGEIDPRDRRRQRLLDLLLPLPMVVAVSAYLAWVARPSAVESVAIFLGYALPPIAGCLVIQRSADMRSPEAIPSKAHRTMLTFSLASVVLVPTLLVVVGDAGWLSPTLVQSLVLCAVVNAGATAQLCFYHARRRLAHVRRDAVASETTVPAARMVSRMRIAIVLPAVAGMLLVADVSSHLAARDAARDRADFAVAATRALVGGGGALQDRVRSVLPSERFWPGDVTAFAVDSDAIGAVDVGKIPDAFLAAVDSALARGETTGPITMRGAEGVGAFGTGADGGSIAVFVAPSEASGSHRAALWLVLAAGVMTAWFASRVSDDLGRAVDNVGAHARRLASGDLREAPVSAADDEFGDLEQGLVNVATAFRGTLGEARRAADGVESTIAELGEALLGIAEASNDQARKVEQVHGLVTSIAEQIGESQGSATALTTGIDESSNSVLELGAAGDELNETASVLTSKVDAVSDSLEQMVRSVKEVGATTDRLAEASEETSSSMEEMASAMRAVDTAAETTMNLSRDVVDKAELGQAKVVQTIAGMEAIREATDAAESVIRGLGARTNEIGGILDVIDDVADETNLLALNAAIIAAQAGEQGKAFSVVADEIKELADRVLASTKEIGGLIRAVQEESENAIGAIEAGSASVMGGVDLSAEAGKTLEEITEASRESGTRISEIVNSVREQTKAASHVVALMERVRESADQIGAASNEQDRGNEIVYRSALTMREVAQQVRRTTEDQAAGFGRIRENVSGVRGAVERISGSLGDQSTVCEQVQAVLDGVAEGSRSNEEAARRVREAMETLAREAFELRGNVERFRC